MGVKGGREVAAVETAISQTTRGKRHAEPCAELVSVLVQRPCLRQTGKKIRDLRDPEPGPELD